MSMTLEKRSFFKSIEVHKKILNVRHRIKKKMTKAEDNCEISHDNR